MAQNYQQKIQELRRKAQRNNGSDRQIHNRIDALRDKKFAGRSKNQPGKVDQDPKPPNAPQGNGPDPIKPSNVYQDWNNPNQGGSREEQGISAYRPAPQAPDPRDDQYWRDVSRLMFDKNAQETSLQTEQTFADTNYQRQLADMQNSEYWDALGQKQASNRAGAFYSTASAEDAGRLHYGYARDRLNLGGQYNADTQTRNLQRAALEQGYTLDEADALAQAIDRQSQAEMNRPSPYQGDLMDMLMKALGPAKGQNNGKGNKHLQSLQKKLKEADNPKDRARIRRRIKRLESKDNGEKQGQKGSQGRQGRQRQGQKRRRKR
jgi:hypothetical protein